MLGHRGLFTSSLFRKSIVDSAHDFVVDSLNFLFVQKRKKVRKERKKERKKEREKEKKKERKKQKKNEKIPNKPFAFA